MVQVRYWCPTMGVENAPNMDSIRAFRVIRTIILAQINCNFKPLKSGHLFNVDNFFLISKSVDILKFHCNGWPYFRGPLNWKVVHGSKKGSIGRIPPYTECIATMTFGARRLKMYIPRILVNLGNHHWYFSACYKL